MRKQLNQIKKTVINHKAEIVIVGVAAISAAGAALLTKKILVDGRTLLELTPAAAMKMHLQGGAMVYETDLGNYMLMLVPQGE